MKASGDPTVGGYVDLNRILGIPIDSNFGTTCDALFKFSGYLGCFKHREEHEVVLSKERWQIEASQANHRPIIKVRRGVRGPWLTNPADLPDIVGNIIRPDPHYPFEIRSTLPWVCWKKSGLSVPHRARKIKCASLVRYTLDIDNVPRKTGKVNRYLDVGLLGFEDLTNSDFYELKFPFSASELMEVIDSLRLRAKECHSRTVA